MLDQPRRWTCTAAEYHAAIDVVSRSMLEDFRESPRLFAGYYVNRDIPRPKPTAAMRLGTLVHLLSLEPELATTIRTPPPVSRRTKAWDEFVAAEAAAGREAYSADELAVGREMTAALVAHRDARALLWGRGESEVTVVWKDADPELAQPIDCRARLDRLVERIGKVLVVDLKTTDNPSPEAFARSLYNWGYHRQAAWYCHSAQALLGVLPQFAFVVVRSSPPYEVAVYKLEPEALAIGEMEVRETLRALSRARRTNTWCAPWEMEPQMINLPVWALKRNSGAALAVKEHP